MTQTTEHVVTVAPPFAGSTKVTARCSCGIAPATAKSERAARIMLNRFHRNAA